MVKFLWTLMSLSKLILWAVLLWCFALFVPTILVLFCRIISASPKVDCGSLHLLPSVSVCSRSDDDYAKLWSMSLAEYHCIFFPFSFFSFLPIVFDLVLVLCTIQTFQQIVSDMGFLSLHSSQLKPIIDSPILLFTTTTL